jgi:hypothetical protein
MNLTPWSEFLDELRADLEPGNLKKARHFAMIAPNRGGKTTLAVDHTQGIIPNIYKNVDVLIIDSTGDPNPPMVDYGNPLQKYGAIHGHRRLTVTNVSSDSKLKIWRAMGKAKKQGNILIYVDEIRQVADPRFFGLQRALEDLWLFGGKRGVVVGGGTQAPRWVPGAFYDQSKVHFIFRIRDVRSRKRLSEISGDVDALNQIVPNLREYEFAYVNPDGDVSVSKLEKGRTKSDSKLVVVQKKSILDEGTTGMG